MLDQDLISGLLECPNEIEMAKGRILVEDLVDDNAKAVYRAMLILGKFDSFTVGNYLRENKQDKALKWMHLIVGTGFGASVEQYAKEIKQASIKRQQIKIAEELIGMSRTDVKPNEIIELFSGRLMSLYEDDEDQLFLFRDLIMDYLGKMATRGKDLPLSGLSTGWKIVDDMTDGLGESQLIIIGARPSMGKTSMMTQIAYSVITSGKCVMMFSCESNRDKIIEKMISQVSGIDLIKFKKNNLTAEDRETATVYFDKMGTDKFFFNDSTGMSVYKMRSLIRQRIREGNKPDIVFVDFIQIMQHDKTNEPLAVRLGRTCQGLKNIAKELNKPVVVMAQLNRDVENLSPNMYNLKASGDLEQIADQVWLLHRENFYKKDRERFPDDKIVVDISKNREGDTGVIELNWIGRYTKIKE